MGSLVPFLDLNLIPDPNSIPNPNVPIRIKPEPVDDFSEPELMPSSPPPQMELNDPNYLSTDPMMAEPISADTENSNVYSEFNRISEMFRNAFAQQMQGLSDGVAEPLNEETGAIVAVPSEEDQVSTAIVERRRLQKRSNELVRVTNLSIEDQRYFREIIRRTRMLYDSLRIYVMADEERRCGPGGGRRARGDLRSAMLMRDKGL